MDGCTGQNPAYRPATEKPRNRGASLLAAVAIYVAVVASVLALADSTGEFWLPLAVIAAASAGAGWVIGRWGAVLLALVPAMLGLPLGYAESTGEAPLVWIFGAFTAPAYALLIVVAVAVRRHVTHRGSDPSESAAS